MTRPAGGGAISPVGWIVAATGAVLLIAAGAPTWLVVGVCGVLGVLGGWRGRSRRGAPPAAWMLVLAADALWAAGFLVFGRQAGPVYADGLMVLHAAAVAALALAIAWHSWDAAGGDVLPVLDSLLLAIALGLVALTFVVPPVLSIGAFVGWHVMLAAASFVALGAALMYLAIARIAMVPATRLLIGAALTVLLTDVVGQLPSGDGGPLLPTQWSSGAHAVCALALGAAAWVRPARLEIHAVDRRRSGSARIVLMTVIALTGSVVLLVGLVSGGPIGLQTAILASSAMICLVTARTMVMVQRLHEQTRRLSNLVDTDPVTGLGNRGRLTRRIDELSPGLGAVLLLDVDRFTELRDSLGPQSADVLLREVAARLRAAVGREATVVRVGSAVFGVLLPGVGSVDDATAVARRVREACTPPMDLGGFGLQVTVTAGVALLGPDGTDPDELLQRADVALTVAADQPGGVVSFGRDTTGRGATAPVLIVELPEALRRRELVVHFQPQVRVLTGEVFAFEALVRWQHPVHGLVPPVAFVQAAERIGLIGRITEYVLDDSLRRCAQWHAAGVHIAVAVNLSVRDLLDPGLVGVVQRLLDAHGVPASMLELEVTETVSMVDPRRAVATLRELAELGVVLSVDDFGAGHSSLAYLQRLPVRRLKIDRAFVVGLRRDEPSRAIVASTIDLARRLGLEVVAEGVEDEETMADLRALSCDAMQGYGLSRPVPPDEVLTTVRSLEARLGAPSRDSVTQHCPCGVRANSPDLIGPQGFRSGRA